MLGQGLGHRRVLQFAEVRLAVLHEDVGDGLAGHRLHVLVGVPHSQAQTLGQSVRDGRLTGPGRADQDGRGPAHEMSERISSGIESR